MTADFDRISIAGVGLECRWVGPRPDQAPTIVMLHEGLGSVRRWRDVPALLAEATGFGVFAYSRAGYGGSDPVSLPRPLSYMHHEALEVLPRVLEAIGFERGLLLGHSDGASIATIYTGGVEDHRIRGLVLIAPHFFVEDVGVASIRAAQAAYASGDLRSRLTKYHGANVDVAFRGWSEAWLDPAFRAWDIRDYIGYVRVPILIVRGRDDQYGTEAQVEVARAESYCPVDAVTIEGAAHSPLRENPEPTLTAIIDFIRSLKTAEALVPAGVTGNGRTNHGS